jgi:hypothetical protein
MTLYRRKQMMEAYDKAEAKADSLIDKARGSKYTALILLGVAVLGVVLLLA